MSEAYQQNITKIPLQIRATQGACLATTFVVQPQPCNSVFVYGQPGALLMATVSAPGKIVDNDDKEYYQFVLNEHGLNSFDVAIWDSPPQSVVLVSVYEISNPANEASQAMSFLPLRVGNGHLYGYSNTTGAPANGDCFCTAYVTVDTGMDIGVITHLVAKVDGNARFPQSVHASQLAYIDLNENGCAEVKISNSFTELVNVTIALPESPDGEFIRFPVDFIEFPIVNIL